EVEVQGGVLTSYDLVRGYEPAPLRMTLDAGASVDGYRLNGDRVDIPRVTRTSWGGQILSDLGANRDLFAPNQGQSGVWQSIAPLNTATVSKNGGAVTVRTALDSWQGVQQVVPADRIAPGHEYTLRLDSRLTPPRSDRGHAPALSPRVAVYEHCDGRAT